MAPAIPGASATEQINPASPKSSPFPSTTSRHPPTSVATTGTPAAMDSSKTKGKPSLLLVKTTKSRFFKYSFVSASPVKTKSFNSNSFTSFKHFLKYFSS